jgi:hypothetical protein
MIDKTQAAKIETVKPKRSLRFKIGLFLLAVNLPFGYGGCALSVLIGLKMHRPVLGAEIGLGIYIISWLMLGLGTLMAGPEGVRLVKEFSNKRFGSKK